MGLEVECRAAASPYVEQVWRSHSSGVDRMTSVAVPYGELVFSEWRGRVEVTLRGPETAASAAPVPEGAVCLGITFSLGTSMPHLPVAKLVDGAVDLPDATRRSFPLKGSFWHLPSYDNAEDFVARLVREGVLARDPVVADALRGAEPEVSERTLQRRFVAATGLTRGAIRQIERARRAAALLGDGRPAQEVVHGLGYFDQPHLARSLSRYVGRTATQLARPDTSEPLSLLYKT